MDTGHSRVNLYQVCSHVLLFMFKSFENRLCSFLHAPLFLLAVAFSFFPKKTLINFPTLSSAFHSKMGSLFGIYCVILLKINTIRLQLHDLFP